LWDSKARTAEVSIKESPTFDKIDTRMNAIVEAVQIIQNSDLSDAVKAAALKNLRKGDFTTNAAGNVGAKNSVKQKYCGNKKC
jgi:hypothetical protein